MLIGRSAGRAMQQKMTQIEIAVTNAVLMHAATDPGNPPEQAQLESKIGPALPPVGTQGLKADGIG